MNKLLITLIGVFTFGAMTPALAGPNWEIIEQARNNAKQRQVKEHQRLTHEQMMQACQEMMQRK